jgi:hypothetical protein
VLDTIGLGTNCLRWREEINVIEKPQKSTGYGKTLSSTACYGKTLFAAVVGDRVLWTCGTLSAETGPDSSRISRDI